MMPRLQKNTAVTARTIEGNIFIYNRKENFIHSFNETGSFLWEHFSDTCASSEALAALLTETFNVDLAEARADTEGFLAECLEKKLLVPHE